MNLGKIFYIVLTFIGAVMGVGAGVYLVVLGGSNVPRYVAPMLMLGAILFFAGISRVSDKAASYISDD